MLLFYLFRNPEDSITNMLQQWMTKAMPQEPKCSETPINKLRKQELML